MQLWQAWLQPKVVKWIVILLFIVLFFVWPGFLRVLVQRLIIAITQATVEMMSFLGPTLGLAITIVAFWIVIRGLVGKK